MATWKKVLREDYAVGATDGLINFYGATTAGASGTIVLSLEDNRTSPTDGEGLETAVIRAGDGISFSGDGIINLTNTGFTVSDGTNSTPIDLGDTLTFEGGGDISVVEDAGTVTISFTAEEQQAVGYTFSDGTNTEAITATNSNPTVVWEGGTYVDVDYAAASNTFTVDLNDAYNHLTFTDGSTSGDVNLGGIISITGTNDISVTHNGSGGFVIDYTDPNPPNVFSTIVAGAGDNIVADSDSDTLTLTGSNGIVLTTTASTDTVDIAAPNGFGRFFVQGAEKQSSQSYDKFYFVEGDNIDLSTPSSPGEIPTGEEGMKISFTGSFYNAIDSDSGTGSAVSGGGTLTVEGGTAINTAFVAATDVLTVNHDNITYTLTNDGTGDATVPVGGGTFDVITGLTVNGQGHTTGAVTSTITIADMVPQVASTNANTDFYLLLQAATGDLAAKIDSVTTGGPTYNPFTETLTVGNLTVDGTQTFLDTTHLAVSDKTITMAADSADAAAANGAAIHVGVAHDGLSETGINLLPKLKWNNASELSGWTIADYNAGSAVIEKHVSTMQFTDTAGAPTAADRGDFHYDTDTDIVYVCIGN